MALQVEITFGGKARVMPPFEESAAVATKAPRSEKNASLIVSSAFLNATSKALKAIEHFTRDSFGLGSFTLRYRDEDQDACTLTAISMADALELARASGILRLEVCAEDDAASDANGSEADREWELVAAAEVQRESSCEDSPRAEEVKSSTSWRATFGSFFGVASNNEGAAAASEEAAAAADPVDAEAEDGAGDPAAGEAANLGDRMPPGLEEQRCEDDGAGDDEDKDDVPRHLSEEDKISFVLAAFDADGDGRLHFEEFAALQAGAGLGELSEEDYEELCCGAGTEQEEGVGTEALRQLYTRGRNLESDFQAAAAALRRTRRQSGSSEDCEVPTLRRLLPVLALPLALGFPLIGVPALGLALGAANSASRHAPCSP